MTSFAELPTELYEAIFSHIAYPDLQQVVLAVTRAIPLSAIPLQSLYASISITRPQQAVHFYRRLRQPPSNGEGGQANVRFGVGRWVRNFTIDTWEVNADVVVNIIPFLSRLHSLTIRVGPKNFAPEHLEEIFMTPMPSLRTLSLRFKPYVEKATYYQFLKGAYFDSTLVALSRWPPGYLSTISIIQEPLPTEEKQVKRDFAQPIVFFRLDLSVLLKSFAISESLQSLRVRIPMRPIARALFSASPHSLISDSIIVPNLEFLDISTCGVLESELDTILSRFISLKHLVADDCSLLRGDLREGEGHDLGKRCALIGVRRAKDREKALKAWLEARALAKTTGNSTQVPVASTRRAPKKGRQGLATATISFRDPPPAIPSGPTQPGTSSAINPSNPPGMKFGKPTRKRGISPTDAIVAQSAHDSSVQHLVSALAQTSMPTQENAENDVPLRKHTDGKKVRKKFSKTDQKNSGKAKSSKPPNPPRKSNEKIRVLPCIPRLTTISIKLTSSVPEVRYEAIRSDFQEGWKEGIAQLAVTRARLRTSAKNGYRIMRITTVDPATNSDSGSSSSASITSSEGSASDGLRAGLNGLEDIDPTDMDAFDVPTGENDTAMTLPIICFAGPGTEGDHEQSCGHSVGREVMGDELSRAMQSQRSFSLPFYLLRSTSPSLYSPFLSTTHPIPTSSMASSTSAKPEETQDSATRSLPTQKLTALTRLKSFGGSFMNSRKASPPIIFPPPSWELNDDLRGKPAPSNAALNESNFQDEPAAEHPEPLSFAERLRSLIESLPIPGSALPSNTSGKTNAAVEDEGSNGKSGAPVPPDLDPKLVRMLSSEEVMNGKQSKSSTEEPDDRPGVWNILASLRKGDTSKAPRRGAVEEEEGGIMMYAPLEPKADSQLELASSEPVVDEAPPSSSKPEIGKNVDVVTEKRVWVPSTTEISVLATWWGYRLYLPPPVMAKLDSTSVKATARAAMVTAALKWILDKMPVMLVPVQFRPAVLMLKKLSPVVGYIGVFIAWSWDRVRTCDQGNGVVLTATWLLPVALLPMTWDAGDIYGPRLPPKPEDMPVPQATGKDNKPTKQAAASAEVPPPSKEKKKRSFFPW